MLADDKAVGDELVEGLLQRIHLREGLVACGDQPPTLGREQVLRAILVQEAEGLHPVQLVGFLHQPGEHLRIGMGRVLLQRQQRAVAAVGGSADLEHLAAKQEAVAADRLPEIVRPDRHRPRRMVQQQPVELPQLGEAIPITCVDAESTRAVVGERRRELPGDVLQLPYPGRQQIAHQALVGALAEDDLGAQCGDAVDEGKPETVLVESPRALNRGIRIANPLREAVRVGPGQVRLHAPAREHGPEAQPGTRNVP